jgi:hypothetical protein
MTAFCLGGTSSAKPGFNGVVNVGTAALGALAVNWPVLWAVPYAALLAGVNWDLTTMCVTDPPADPGFTAADALAMLNGFSVDATAFTNASLKLQQLLQRYAWNQFCQCDSIATPSPPAAPAAPAGLPVANPGVIANSAPCLTFAPPMRQRHQESAFSASDDYVGTSIPTISYAQVPAGATSFVATCTILETSGTSDTYTLKGRWGNGTELGTTGEVTHDIVGSGTGSITVPLVSGKTGIRVFVISNTTFAKTWNETVSVNVYCGSSTGAPGAACCYGGDPITQGVLHQILDLVTLIQRQVVPFAYIVGTAHAALTGAGTFAIQGLLGVKAVVTTLPSHFGLAGSSPAEHFDLGYLTFGTADGYPSSYRLEHSPQVILPERCSAYTILAYDLKPGVIVTISELKREP